MLLIMRVGVEHPTSEASQKGEARRAEQYYKREARFTDPVSERSERANEYIVGFATDWVVM